MKKSLASLLNFLDCDFTLSKGQVLFAFLALLIIGLGLRCGYWAMRDRPPRDEKFYIQTVNDINNNIPDWFEKNDYPPPLMQRIAALSCRGGFTAETALHTLNMVYAMLWVWIMFFLCRDVFDDNKAGLLGMALAAFNPYSVRMASQILREPLYILLFTMGLWCTVRLVKSEKVNVFYPAIIGVLTILGFYTRFEGVEIALFVTLAAIILCKKQCFRQAAANFTIYFLTVTLLAGGLIYAGDSYMQKIPGKISWVRNANNK